jgi:hypothetical protein
VHVAGEEGGEVATPFVAAFALEVVVPEGGRGGYAGRLRVSADERFELFCNGERVRAGPERGGPVYTAFETLEVELPAGRQVLVARVWALGKLAPWAQVSVRPGLIVAASDEVGKRLFATGFAPWRARVLPGYSFRSGTEMLGQSAGVGPSFDLDGRVFPWDFATAAEGDAVVVGDAGTSGHVIYSRWKQHLLRPARLRLPGPSVQAASLVRHAAAADTGTRIDVTHNVPRLRAEFIGLTRGREVLIGAGEFRRVLIDLDDYVCGYPELVVAGGGDAVVEVSFAESLTASPGGRDKGNRDEIEGKHFSGFGDRYTLDGGERLLRPLWWRCGRYVELRIRCAGDAVRLKRFQIARTGYEAAITGEAACDDTRLNSILPTCVSGWRACLHETYMDCPYYEQMMYVGDTRVQALLTYVLSQDAAPVAKALADFDSSRANPTLLVTSNNGPSGQMIPPFALWWVCMVADYARWRGGRERVAALLPGCRAVVDAFLVRLVPEGLAPSLPGWNYVDAGFPGGVPPGGEPGGISAAINLQLVIALDDLGELEAFAGDGELAARHRRRASEVFAAARTRFLTSQGFADDAATGKYSEQTQALAIISRRLTAAETDAIAGQLAQIPAGWTKSQLYFSHYLFEAARESGAAEILFSRLPTWYDLQGQGFRTFPETLGETRSDCHAWSSHPRFHLAASIVGVRPAEMGFASVEIRPMLGPLQQASATVPHPLGPIRAEVTRDNPGTLRVRATLPEGLRGVVRSGGHVVPIGPGECDVRVSEFHGWGKIDPTRAG